MTLNKDSGFLVHDWFYKLNKFLLDYTAAKLDVFLIPILISHWLLNNRLNVLIDIVAISINDGTTHTAIILQNHR